MSLVCFLGSLGSTGLGCRPLDLAGGDWLGVGIRRGLEAGEESWDIDVSGSCSLFFPRSPHKASSEQPQSPLIHRELCPSHLLGIQILGGSPDPPGSQGAHASRCDHRTPYMMGESSIMFLPPRQGCT